MRAALAEASPRAAAAAETASGDAGARAPDAPRRAILGLVSLLAEDFAAHENPNRRKGGLLGLAAVVVGLGGDGETGDGDGECVQRATRVATSEKRLVARAATRAAVPPVLAAFCDLDARVRYYACEAMYNIVKTARGGLLLLTESRGDDDDFFYDENGNVSADSDSFLRRLFDAACDLSADADADVQNAAHLLDGLVKDVVSEAFHDAEDDERVQGDVLQEHVGGSRLGACLVSAIASRAVARESENVLSENDSRRSPVRGTHRRVASSRDPYARQFLIGWIVALDATPQMDALRALPEFFDGLLLMLSDPNREIRAQADGCLRTFLTEIKALFDADKGAGADADARRRRVDVARLSATLERHTRSADEFTRVTAVTWLREFVALAGRAGAGAGAGKTPGNRRNEPRFPEENDGFARVAEMTRAVLPCLSHAEAKVRDVAARAAEELLEAARAAAAAGTLDLDALLSALAACAGVQTDSRAAGAETGETAETGAETPRNLDEHLDAEIASPSYALDAEIASGETLPDPEPILSRDPARVDAVAGEATRAEALRWYLALLETAPEETRTRMLLRTPRTNYPYDALGGTRDGKRRTSPETSPNGEKRSLLFLSDSLASVFLNLSSASDLATARATDALAHLGSGSDDAFDAVARALALALFEDEACASRTRKASNARDPSPRREIESLRDAVETNGVDGVGAVISERRPTFLKRRGSATIRRMCFVLGDARVVRRLAEVVAEMAAPALRRAAVDEHERDGGGDDDDDDDALAFAANAADALNAIALAAPECARLRRTLRGGDDAFEFAGTEDARDDGRDPLGGFSEKESLLRGLFPCWCHSPAATIGLCLLSGLDATAYFCAEHTARDETELTRDALVRLDRLVHLFETPPFAGARLRLLAPEKNKSARPHLRRALAAVLALLPQSSAFRALRDRLGACAPPPAGEQGGSETEESRKHEAVSPFAARAFRAARAAHARARERAPKETLSS